MSDPITGVADNGNLPGTILDPNTQNLDLAGGANLEQFGTELDKPETDAAQGADPKTDPKRFEFWQSKAQAAEDAARKLGEEVNRRKQFDPLIDLVRKDETVYRIIQDRLSGKSATTEKPLEAPQRPSAYNEVEAYSNPESASFKFRQANEDYKEARYESAMNKVNEFQTRLERQKDELQQEQARREASNAFRKDVVSKGISEEEFEEFFGLVNNAKSDDLVDYFKFKKGQSGSTRQPVNYSRPEPSGGSTRTPSPRPGQPMDIGKSLVDTSRSMF